MSTYPFCNTDTLQIGSRVARRGNESQTGAVVAQPLGGTVPVCWDGHTTNDLVDEHHLIILASVANDKSKYTRQLI